jgi:predicted NAD/FAD-binding protein
MRIAVVGSGISGLVAANLLSKKHEVTVFEANGYIGGHTNTRLVERYGQRHLVDTGFIVFNDWTYPNFIKLLDQLSVETQLTSMSFSVRCEHSGLEYNGTSLNTLFSQRTNFFRPSFHRMVRDILRFNREARELIKCEGEEVTLSVFLKEQKYSSEFVEHYIVPMGAAIWSTDPELMFEFPARYFATFFHNHGFLSVNDRPQWRVIKGGSHNYVPALTEPFQERIRLNHPITGIKRMDSGIEIQPKNKPPERFEKLIVATHSDQALRMLQDPTSEEKEILGAIPYQPNDVVLHTDDRLLPRKKLSWACWNYHIPKEQKKGAQVTYNMNMLQTLSAPETFCVTLNGNGRLDQGKVIERMTYDHPLYHPRSIVAQKRHGEVNGRNHTYYCGAYWGYGFHEDGVNSALAVCKNFGVGL